MKHFSLYATVFLLFSCANDTDEPQDFTLQNDNEIITYLEDNNLSATKTASGLYYLIENQGSGTTPTPSSEVRVVYKGYFTTGVVFDQSNATGISFLLNQVIPGWTEGLTYFKEGGTGKLFVPSALGYGPNDYGSIPGGSVLIFDIELKEITN